MLRVNIELVPCGDEQHKRTLSTMTIANIGGDHEVGEYRVDYITDVTPDGQPRRFVSTIQGWDRRKSASLLVAHAFSTINAAMLDCYLEHISKGQPNEHPLACPCKACMKLWLVGDYGR